MLSKLKKKLAGKRSKNGREQINAQETLPHASQQPWPNGPTGYSVQHYPGPGHQKLAHPMSQHSQGSYSAVGPHSYQVPQANQNQIHEREQHQHLSSSLQSGQNAQVNNHEESTYSPPQQITEAPRRPYKSAREALAYLIGDIDHNLRHRDSPTAPEWYNQAPLEFIKGAPGYLCQTCRRIDIMPCIRNLSADNQIGLRDYIFLGSITEIFRKADCELCRLVISAIRFTIKTTLPPGITNEVADILLQDAFEPRLEELIYLTPFRYDNTTTQLYLVSAPPGSTPESARSSILDTPMTSRPTRTMGFQLMVDVRGAGRRIQTDRIDVDWIKERMRLCDASMLRMTVDHKGLVRAIDVNQGCVVDLRDGDRYATLSYVWGQSKQLMLTRETEESLRRPNGIFELQDKIPKTITDAIALVKAIGENYIWVDALCIRQDDNEDKKSQIRNMGNVYKESVVTIVAACGRDATYGLPGVTPGTRNIDQAICTVLAPILPGQLADFTIASTLPDDEALQNTIWKTRAWTMQEKVLARKTLYITDWGVIFHCRHGLNIEDRNCWHPNPPEPEHHNDSRMYWWDDHHPLVTARIPNFSNFDTYAFIVSDYSRRNLTFHGDAHNAIAGVIDRIWSTFWVPFIHALPPAELEAALLWSPIGKSVRRVDDKTGEALFPSWSWLGWAGHAAYPWVIERKFAMSSRESPLMFCGRDPNNGGPVWISLYMYTMPFNYMSWKKDPEDDWLFIKPNADDTGTRFIRPLAFGTNGSYLHEKNLLQGEQGLYLKSLVARFRLATEIQKRKTKYDYDHEIYQMRILDHLGYGVGYIDVPDPSTMSDEQRQLFSGSFDFIAITRCALGPKPQDHPQELGPQYQMNLPPLSPQDDHPQFWHDEALFDLRVYDGTPGWSMWNVLMVRQVGALRERLAVGRIHVVAFGRAQPLEREMLLK